MDLLKDLKMLLLNFSFVVMIYKIHKTLILLKIHLNLLTVVFLNAFLRSTISFYFFSKKNYFFITYDNGKFKSSRRKYN